MSIRAYHNSLILEHSILTPRDRDGGRKEGRRQNDEGKKDADRQGEEGGGI